MIDNHEHPDAREWKLPKWAAEKIERLRNKVNYLLDESMQGPEGSDTFADPYLSPKPLGLGQSIQFRFKVGDTHPSDNINVRMTKEGYLEVQGGSNLAVRPSAANALEIHLLDAFGSQLRKREQ